MWGGEMKCIRDEIFDVLHEARRGMSDVAWDRWWLAYDLHKGLNSRLWWGAYRGIIAEVIETCGEMK